MPDTHDNETRLITEFGATAARRGMKKAVFLDRDGVLIKDQVYLSEVSGIQILPGVIAGLKHLAPHYRLVMVTNQSGIARGIFSTERLQEIHRALLGQLEQDGVAIDAVYYCPHLAGGKVAEYSFQCDCRKPLPGMLLRAMRDLDLLAGECFMLGDQETDMAAARAAGAYPILIAGAAGATRAAAVCTDLEQAAGHIVTLAGSRKN